MCVGGDQVLKKRKIKNDYKIKKNYKEDFYLIKFSFTVFLSILIALSFITSYGYLLL